MIGVTAAEFFDFGEDVVLGKSISVGKKIILKIFLEKFVKIAGKSRSREKNFS
jgi:hypothetical protein